MDTKIRESSGRQGFPKGIVDGAIGLPKTVPTSNLEATAGNLVNWGRGRGDNR